MVRSIKIDDDEPEMTHFAPMYHFWYIMRWLVYPTPATYEAIPELLRPTPYQLFRAHLLLFDFMAWPEIRDLCAQNPGMSTDTRWILEMAKTIKCDWRGHPSDLLHKNPITGEIDLTPAAKVSFVVCPANVSFVVETNLLAGQCGFSRMLVCCADDTQLSEKRRRISPYSLIDSSWSLSDHC